jgi:L-ribulokinase
MRLVLEENHVNGQDVAAIALDTTGSSVIPVDAAMQPLDDYYLWCDHRAHEEARQNWRWPKILRRSTGCLFVRVGFAKLLHWLRHNPQKRERFATALEHCVWSQPR